MNMQSVIGNLDINKILNDNQVSVLFLSNDYEKVYEDLRTLSQKYSNDFKIQKNLKNILFIYYLKTSYRNIPRKNYYERVLLNMLTFLDEEVLEFLLSQDIDINYVGYDIYNSEIKLADELALYIESPRAMSLLLQKQGISTRKYFSDRYDNYTDLCRMSIIAGNLDKALEIFNSEEYKLVLEPLNIDSIFKKLIQKDNLYLEYFLGEQSDILLQVIRTIKDSQLLKENKSIFLNQILYSQKIKIFNVFNFNLIKEMLSEEDCLKFENYLKEKVSKEEIVLYSLGYKDNLLLYESLESTFQIDKVLILEKNSEIN